MTRNPYAPPKADVDLVPKSLPPKPLAVRTFEIVGWISFVGAALGVVMYFLQLFDPRRQPVGPADAWLGFGIRLAIALAVALTLVLVRRRSRVGQVFGIGLIALLGSPAVAVFGMQAEGATEAYLLGRKIACLVIGSLFLYWIFSFCFSAKARAYFRAVADPSENQGGRGGP